MIDETILQRNLLAISPKNSRLTAEIAQAEVSSRVHIAESKKGFPVPAIFHNGKERALHSLFDPKREGQRIAESYPKNGYYVFFGLGAGFHIFPFISCPDISYILIIERDIPLCKAILGSIDLRELLLNPKVNLIIDYTPEQIKKFILSNYFPAINGNLQTFNLRSRFEVDNEYFSDSLLAIKDCISTLSDDYTVQAYFGKKWFTNTLANLESAEKSTTVLRPIQKAMVTGAGPSLEIFIEEIKDFKKNNFYLIATDTSLPSLLKHGIVPDVVISIDCQHITYHHFLSGYPEHIPLVIDLASPPPLTRLTKNLVFFTSGHPFSLYVNSHWRQFPYIDISGGNVSHAAVSLADTLGAKLIYLFGTDFSYPEGKSYARGTYIYPYFRTFESRIEPIEHHFFSFLLRNSNITKDYFNKTVRYTTKPMISYKERLENACSELSAEVKPFIGNGVTIEIPPKIEREHQHGKVPALFSAGRSSSPWKVFLSEYLEGLTSLKLPKNEPVSTYFYGLSASERDLWTTLLPAAAALRREHHGDEITSRNILGLVRNWSIELITHFLHLS